MPGFMNRGPDALESLAAASPATSTPLHPNPNPEDGPAHRLAHVSERFSQFYNDLENEKAQRREAENGRRNALYDQVQRLELDLETEDRRHESDRLLREKVEADLRAMEEGTRRTCETHDMELKASVDALSALLR